MLVKDLKELFSGIYSNSLVLFKVGTNETISFDMIEVSYETREVIFRKTVQNEEEKHVNMYVSKVFEIIENLNPSWNVVFEDIDEPSETFNINSAEVSILNDTVILKNWNM